MFNGASNVQLGEKIFKFHYPRLMVMCGVKHTVSLILNVVSKIPMTKYMSTAHKEIYNVFGSGIYHNPHLILK